MKPTKLHNYLKNGPRPENFLRGEGSETVNPKVPRLVKGLVSWLIMIHGSMHHGTWYSTAVKNISCHFEFHQHETSTRRTVMIISHFRGSVWNSAPCCIISLELRSLSVIHYWNLAVCCYAASSHLLHLSLVDTFIRIYIES